MNQTTTTDAATILRDALIKARTALGHPDNIAEIDAALAAAERAAIQPAGEAVYVPIAVHVSDFAQGCHPNDTTKPDAECQDALDARGDDKGQGLDPYWKWGFRAGWEAKCAAPIPQQAKAEQVSEREFAEGVVYACARLAEWLDQPTLAKNILDESGVNISQGCEDDVSALKKKGVV